LIGEPLAGRFRKAEAKTQVVAKEMTDKTEHRHLKITVDVLSIIAVVSLISVPVWCVYDPDFHSHGVPGALPIQLKVLMLDGIPFVFGSVWLIFRYGIAASRKYPFILTLRFRLLLWAAAIVVGTYLSVLLAAK
jgi:hypothetical protein